MLDMLAVADGIVKHLDSLPDDSNLGKTIPPYRPTFNFDGYLTKFHKFLSECPSAGVLIQLKDRRWRGDKIEGWLRREDALKLYELAYMTDGDVFDIGTYQGLSPSILGRALRDSRKERIVYTCDIYDGNLKIAAQHLRRLGLSRYVQGICADATDAVRTFADQGKRFGFIFIDHSHAYQQVFSVARGLRDITASGGFCLFHDYNDVRNMDPNDPDYGVYQAARDAMDQTDFEFCGVYGCTGLYRRM
jgi:predicted O-methyltransferase YrrM